MAIQSHPPRSNINHPTTIRLITNPTMQQDTRNKPKLQPKILRMERRLFKVENFALIDILVYEKRY